MPLACKPTVIIPRGAATADLTVTFPSTALSAIVTLAIVRPGGRGKGEIASAPSAPLVRVTLTGIVAFKPWATSIAAGGVSRSTGRARAGAATRPYSVIEQVARGACWAYYHGLECEPFDWAVDSLARATSLIGAAGNLASAAAESESTPVVWPAAIVPGPHGQSRGRIGDRRVDRPGVALALDGHADRGRAAAGNAHLGIVELRTWKSGIERLDHDPIREARRRRGFPGRASRG